MDLSYDPSKASGAPIRSSVGFEEDMGEGGLGNNGGGGGGAQDKGSGVGGGKTGLVAIGVGEGGVGA